MINEENEKASDLLHEIFVEKARKIYANMIKEDQDIERDLNEADWDYDTSDAEDDLEYDTDDFDVSGLNDEIDNEEMYEAEPDDEESEMDAEFDLAGDMSADDEDMGDEDMDMGSEMDADDLAGDVGDAGEADEAFMNVEDALAELKAAFAELVGNGETESEDEAEDEFDANDYEYDDEAEDEVEKPIKESAALSKVATPKNKVGDDGKASPVAKVKDSDKMGKPLKNALKNSEEKGGTAAKPKPIGVPGPQDVGTKLKPASVRKMKD